MSIKCTYFFKEIHQTAKIVRKKSGGAGFFLYPGDNRRYPAAFEWRGRGGDGQFCSKRAEERFPLEATG